MKLVTLESPCAGNVIHNRRYARRAMLDSLNRGESPMVSHLLYTQVLNDLVPKQREIGIAAGLAWRHVSEKTVVYTDFGISDGMKYGIRLAEESGKPIEYREIGK